jgi:Mg2+ and Co2+ transporter CorA
LRVRRFDADRPDRDISLKQALAAAPGSRQLLWIDLRDGIDPADMAAIGKRFDIDRETRRALEDPNGRPRLAVHGSYLHVSVAVAPGADQRRPSSWLHVVASRNVVITRRVGTVDALDEIDERIKADTTLGAIEGAEFVAMLLDGIVTTYLVAVDEVEDEIDRLDERSLGDKGRRKVLEDLVAARRRIARLRRSLSAQRTLFTALEGPDLRQVVGDDAAIGLRAVGTRFEAALGAVEASRTALLGSFDVYMTRTAQRTNDVMKVLTIATVLLLPGSVIAGLLGMNVIVPLDKDDPMSFWLVLAGVGLLAVVVLAVAYRRRWI